MRDLWEKWCEVVMRFCCEDTVDKRAVCLPCTGVHLLSQLKDEGLAHEEPAVLDGVPEEGQEGAFHAVQADDA